MSSCCVEELYKPAARDIESRSLGLVTAMPLASLLRPGLACLRNQKKWPVILADAGQTERGQLRLP